jgi:hypothetical protein
MTFKFQAHRKGLKVTTGTTGTPAAFPTDGTQATKLGAIRVENRDATNAVYFQTGNSDMAATDDSAHIIKAGETKDFIRRAETDTHYSLKAAAGTPVVVMHFGTVQGAD